MLSTAPAGFWCLPLLRRRPPESAPDNVPAADRCVGLSSNSAAPEGLLGCRPTLERKVTEESRPERPFFNAVVD